MIHLKLSPSKIESFRLYLDEEYNGTITKKSFIETITGVKSYSKKADFGTAFHLVMEKGAGRFYNEKTKLYDIRDDKDLVSPIICTWNEIRLADEFHKRYPSMNYETWLAPVIQLDNYSITLNLRIDGLLGNEIHENKTSTRGLNVDFYERSSQWKSYMVATTAEVVQYNLFNYKEPTEIEEGKTRRAGTRVEREVTYTPFRLYRGGPEIEQEVYKLIRGVIRFCENNDLMEYIIVK